MRKLGRKGFTLIELLAVITILGILMMVAIPAVSRTIENSRRDTYVDLAKTYINTVRNAVLADELKCNTPSSTTDYKISVGATPNGYYYFRISTAATTDTTYAYVQTQTSDIMESGGLSSWSNADVEGYIAWHKYASGETTKSDYSVLLVDTGKHGIEAKTAELDLSRTTVSTATTLAAGSTTATEKVTYPPKEKKADGSVDTTITYYECKLK